MIKMIALDLDGTLAIDNHQVSPATREALTILHDGGVEVVIATGRRYRTTRYVIENLGFDVFAVCNGGALIKNADTETLHAETFDIAPVVEAARATGLNIFSQRDAHATGGPDFYVDSGLPFSAAIARYLEDNEGFGETTDLAANSNDEFLVAGTFAPVTELEKFIDQLHRSAPGVFNTVMVNHKYPDVSYCEVSQAHVDKWHGLGKLADHKSVAPENMCAVGDDMNDLPMIKGVAHGVAMGNGHPTLKEHAQLICGDNKKDGLLDVVRYIEDINARAEDQ